MTLDRRTVLGMAGTTSLASLAGCSSLSNLLSPRTRYEYTLSIDRVDQSLVAYATYTPTESSLSPAAARDALDAVLPDGRHTTYGFEPLPADAYIEHNDRYFQTKVVVTGRKRMQRRLVRVEPVDRDSVTDGTTRVGSLPQASGRVVKILHSHHLADGSGTSKDLLRADAYVLRRPEELDGPIAGDLDGEVVTMGESDHWAYRISVTTETVTEPAYETVAVEVATERAAFRDVVLSTRIDADVDASDLDGAVRGLLEKTIDGDHHRETTPLSRPFAGLIERLGLAGVDVGTDGRLLWYEESLSRYRLYVTPVT